MKFPITNMTGRTAHAFLHASQKKTTEFCKSMITITKKMYIVMLRHVQVFASWTPLRCSYHYFWCCSQIHIHYKMLLLLTGSVITHLRRTMYEGWNFNFGNAALTFGTAHLQSSYFHTSSMYSPKLCRTRSQRWRSRMMPLAAPVLLMVRTVWSTAEGLNPPCNCPIR